MRHQHSKFLLLQAILLLLSLLILLNFFSVAGTLDPHYGISELFAGLVAVFQISKITCSSLGVWLFLLDGGDFNQCDCNT